jgi:prolyl-tRNA editing enzyme YbaK/EbsC (Cys-tRNA(Pro) deacylase)
MNAEELPRACRQVAEAAARAGIAIDIRIMPDSTRTADKAAAACGCDVAQIVKSLVFRGKESGRPLLFLVSGANRLDAQKARAAAGEDVERPDAGFVRDVTGFAIGGIPPFGHARPLATWIDEDLTAFATIFAAAGTPNAIFAAAPADVVSASDAATADLKG